MLSTGCTASRRRRRTSPTSNGSLPSSRASSWWIGRVSSAGRTSSAPVKVWPGSASSRATTRCWQRPAPSPRTSPALLQKRQHDQRVGFQPGLFAYPLGFEHELLGLRFLAHIEIRGGEAVVAGKQQLGLADALDQVERLAIVAERSLGVAAALVDLAEHDERDGQVVELAELAVEVERDLGGGDAFFLAPIRERTVGHGQVGVQPGLQAEVPDLPSHLEARLAGLDRPPRI